MSDLISLDVVDADGAIREAQENVAGDTRADLFRRAAIGVSILTVEARHASYLRELNNKTFAPRSFDKPASARQVRAKAKAFIK